MPIFDIAVTLRLAEELDVYAKELRFIGDGLTTLGNVGYIDHDLLERGKGVGGGGRAQNRLSLVDEETEDLDKVVVEGR